MGQLTLIAVATLAWIFLITPTNAGETLLSTILTPTEETKAEKLSRQSRQSYYDFYGAGPRYAAPRYAVPRPLYERLEYDRPSRCGRCLEDRYDDDYDRGRDRYDDDDDRRVSHRPTYGNRHDRNRNDRDRNDRDRDRDDDDDDRRYNTDRRNGDKNNGTNDEQQQQDGDNKKQYDDSDKDDRRGSSSSSGGRRDRDRHRDRDRDRGSNRNRYDDRDRYRPDYYDRFLRDPYRERIPYGYEDPYQRRPLYDRYPAYDRYDDPYAGGGYGGGVAAPGGGYGGAPVAPVGGYGGAPIAPVGGYGGAAAAPVGGYGGGRYDAGYAGVRRPVYDDRFDRGNGYDDTSYGGYGPSAGRGPHDSFRPWDETYRGQAGWDAGGRGYYFASGRPEATGGSTSWRRPEYARPAEPAAGSWQNTGYGGGQRDQAAYQGSFGYPQQDNGYRQDASYRPSGWHSVGERRPYRDQSGVNSLDNRDNYGQTRPGHSAQSGNYGQSGSYGQNSNRGQSSTYGQSSSGTSGAYGQSSSTTPGTSYLYEREDEQVITTKESVDTTTKTPS